MRNFFIKSFEAIASIIVVIGVVAIIAGSAIGSVLAQIGAAAALCVVVLRGARRHGASLRPALTAS